MGDNLIGSWALTLFVTSYKVFEEDSVEVVEERVDLEGVQDMMNQHRFWIGG